MKISIDCNIDDPMLVLKGLKAYMQLHDANAVVSIDQGTDVEFLRAIELLSKKIVMLEDEFKQHVAVGDVCPHTLR